MGLFALFFGLNAAQQVLFHLFIYWDLDADHLHERRLWNTRDVGWQEVTHIGPWGQSSQYLVVDHARLAPMSDSGSLIANPEDRSGFISALHRYAPQASFDV
jgi:hypothetical protein